MVRAGLFFGFHFWSLLLRLDPIPQRREHPRDLIARKIHGLF